MTCRFFSFHVSTVRQWERWHCKRRAVHDKIIWEELWCSPPKTGSFNLCLHRGWIQRTTSYQRKHLQLQRCYRGKTFSCKCPQHHFRDLLHMFTSHDIRKSRWWPSQKTHRCTCSTEECSDQSDRQLFEHCVSCLLQKLQWFHWI